MRHSNECNLSLIIASVSGLLVGCARPESAPKNAAPSADEISRTVQRTDASFSDAIYYKPVDETPEAMRRMAPLLVQGVAAGSTLSGVPRIAPISSQSTAPAIRLSHSTAVVAASKLSQWVWSWEFPSSERLHCERGQPIAQTVRMTLDSHGSPVIWEVFDCRERIVLVFVARSLEAAAARTYGAALPGRKYAVERSLEEQPSVIVAAVLEDGPEPMGPFIYLDENCRTTTVLCRCMPARFENAIETLGYRVEMENRTASPRSRHEGPPLQRDWMAPDWLEKALRLPPQF